MKNLFITLIISQFILSCNPKENKQNIVKEEITIMNDTELDSIKSLEDELIENAIGGEGIVFENGGMSFNIESLESSAKEVEQKLDYIKSNNDYESENLKKNAIESMEMNLKMFQGNFCCTTHNSKHCSDSKDLRKLKSKFGCERFMKE